MAINGGNQQRLILVAAQFRKEVTSTVLWLLSHSIRLQCFKATPYAMGDNLFLNLEQIIPTPEAAEYMIGISQKEAAEKTTEKVTKSREQTRLEFWAKALEVLRASKTSLFNSISPSKGHWVTGGSGVSGCPLVLIFGGKLIRVELCLSRSSKAANKFLYDQLFAQKDKIEEVFGDKLSWERLNDKISSYVRYGLAVDGDNRDNWSEMIAWLVAHIIKLEFAFRLPLANAAIALKNAGIESGIETNAFDRQSGAPEADVTV